MFCVLTAVAANILEDRSLNILNSEKKDKGVIEVLVEVSPEEYDLAAGKAFIKNKNRVSVPGFRKGKAPRRIVEKMYGQDVFLNDSLEILYPDIIKPITEDSSYKIVDQPRITDIDFNEDKGGINVTLSFSVYPEVTIGQYKGLSVPKGSYEVADSEIDKEIDLIRERNARIESVQRPAADGDTTIIDFEGFVDGVPFDGGKAENYQLVLGSGQFIPGFEEQVCGMDIGEERDVNLVFPDEYVEHLAGKSVVFKVKLHEVKEKQLPDVDDEFVKDVSEFDTVDEYKADTKERLEKARKAEVDGAFESALMEQLIENLDVQVPDAMVEDHMDLAMRNLARQLSSYNMEPASYFQMMGMTPEEYRENSRAGCEKQVKVTIALEKIAELEAIELSDEDIEKELTKVSEELNKDIDELKEIFNRESFAQDLKLRAAAELVVDSAVATAPEESETDSDSEPSKKTPPKKGSTKKK